MKVSHMIEYNNKVEKHLFYQAFRKAAISQIKDKVFVYVISNLHGAKIYVGATFEGRVRLQRHLTGGRSDPVGNRFFCPSEIGTVEVYPCETIKEAKALEAQLLVTLNESRELFNIKIPESYTPVAVPVGVTYQVNHDDLFQAAKHPAYWNLKMQDLLTSLLNYRMNVKDSAGVRKAIRVRRSMNTSYQRDETALYEVNHA